MYFFFSVYLQFGLSFFVNADQDTVLYWPVDDQYYRKNIEPTPEVCLHRNQIWIFPFTPKQNGQGNFRHATHQHPDLSKLTSSLQTNSNSIINGTAVYKVIHFTAIVRTCFENSEIFGGNSALSTSHHTGTIPNAPQIEMHQFRQKKKIKMNRDEFRHR